MSLNNKQQAFVEAYLGCGFNASEAARQAGYAKPGQQGHRLLKNVEIDAAIRQGLTDRAMPADEVLARIAEHARADIRDLVAFDDEGKVSGLLLNRDAPLYLIKSLTPTRYGTKIELHDQQAALTLLGKHYGLFAESDDWRTALEQMGINAADFFGRLVERVTPPPSEGA